MMCSARVITGKIFTLNKNLIALSTGRLFLRSMTSSENVRQSNAGTDKTIIRQQILEASLSFVNKHGWSHQTIGYGAESLGMPNVAHGLFPNGGLDLVLYFYNQCNGNLVKLLEEHKSLNMTPFDFIWFAIRERLLMNMPYIKQWPQALALLALPNNILSSIHSILQLSDDICYYAGDRSVDFHWYSRRMAVLAIYQSTELYMLQDASHNYESTWKFLSRRVKDAEEAKANLDKVNNIVDKNSESANAAFMTIKNILNLH